MTGYKYTRTNDVARKTSVKRTPAPVEHYPQPYHLPNDAPWGGFINMRLDEEQKAAFHAWFADAAPHVEASIDDMLGLGIKLSLSYDWENQCFICSVTGGLVGSDPQSRYTSTSRAGSRLEALGLTVWKHYALTEGDYGNYAPKSGFTMSWG